MKSQWNLVKIPDLFFLIKIAMNYWTKKKTVNKNTKIKSLFKNKFCAGSDLLCPDFYLDFHKQNDAIIC